ncbi:hypothetical protein GGF32_004505 [Allomyces javanicus]|nr:hypothetical protein GGF32_004505 [Allomyces javanicus]
MPMLMQPPFPAFVPLSPAPEPRFINVSFGGDEHARVNMAHVPLEHQAILNAVRAENQATRAIILADNQATRNAAEAARAAGQADSAFQIVYVLRLTAMQANAASRKLFLEASRADAPHDLHAAFHNPAFRNRVSLRVLYPTFQRIRRLRALNHADIVLVFGPRNTWRALDAEP